MRMRNKAIASFLIVTAAAALWCEESGSPKAMLQQRLAEIKESMAANQAKLKRYQWLQTTQVFIKGEKKKEEQAQCRYGADGKLQRTVVSTPPPQQAAPKGLKGKIVEKKVAEMKDYTDRLKSLVGHYAPPDPQKMKAVAQAGMANLDVSAGVATLTFKGYYKPGDQIVFAFDTEAKKLRSYNVNTYLDDPVKDVVTVANQFATLPDGTNYLAETSVISIAKEIQIKTTNSGHSLLPH